MGTHAEQERRDLGALVITIEEERQGLEELIELLERETELLLAGEQRELLDNLSLQEKIMRRLGKLEEQRLKLLEALQQAGRWGSAPARLGELAQVLSEPDRGRVDTLARTMAEHAHTIRTLEARNRRLIEAGRRCLDGFLALLLPEEPPLTYGQASVAASGPRFFSSEA